MTGFREARDLLLKHRDDSEAARATFRWPDTDKFNWALDWFDAVLAREPDSRDANALTIVDSTENAEQRVSFSALSLRSNQMANYLSSLGVKRGDRILVLLGNVLPLWEVMLGAMKIGAVLVPSAPLLKPQEIADRLVRAGVKLAITAAAHADKFDSIDCGKICRILIGPDRPGWERYSAVDACSETFAVSQETRADDPLFLYFTSGATAVPKMVLHSHRSYPVGHLSTMYWIGLKSGDIHLNISSPGWAKHAWSCFFAPWNAGAAIFILNQDRFDVRTTLRAIEKYRVTTLCAPPTAWRSIVLEDLSVYSMNLRELTSAGEPLNPEVMNYVKRAWGLTIREGFGQTESTAIIGNSPGQTVKPGSMGRPLPGYRVAVRNADGVSAQEGELCVLLRPAPAGLMLGYASDSERTEAAIGGSQYGTGDVASQDVDGYFWFVGRTDDVFKSSDYRISPFELESALVEHPLVVEAAVVPVPDEFRLAIPKAYVILRSGTPRSQGTAASIFEHLNMRLAPFKRIRRIEFVAELPKTISGKIRRVQLKQQETENCRSASRPAFEFREEDLFDRTASSR
jgi:acetyl-CoA synthetase